MDLVLKPHLTGIVDDVSISMHMVMDIPGLKKGDPLIAINLMYEGVPSQPYTTANIRVTDDHGRRLPVYTEDSMLDVSIPRRTWFVGHDICDRVTFNFEAKPRKVDRHTKVATRSDLRYEGGGLQGSGSTLLPAPAFNQGQSRTWKMKLSWDLADTPTGTRAVWSFGEGPGPVVSYGTSIDLIDTIFSVGPLQSYPKPDVKLQTFAMYWIGDLPQNIAALQKDQEATFAAMSVFCNDPPSPANPYRIFVRNAAPASGYGGSSFTRSYMLEYDGRIDSIDEEDLVSLLTHEMAHNWLRMGKRVGASGDEAANDEGSWYTEGIMISA
ncbi:hypothetical protein ANO11243_049980 [Dothideomycetidae sp. 11243]|nr:hypothetical protein ANO11243_049980 [fungal sp. No.11243]